MAYVKIENNIVVFKTYEVDETLIHVPDSVCCGMTQNADGTFSNPTISTEELMDRLRQQRTQLLAQTDWRFRSDLTPSQAWIDYCQALRDLPANSTPTLDEYGNLTGVNWPTPPEN